MKYINRKMTPVILAACVFFAAVLLAAAFAAGESVGSGSVPEKATPTPAVDGGQYNWRISGEGELPFTTPGMKGTNKMIVKLDLTKQDGATPAGTYSGSFSVWYYEMTPELMKEYGITGDSHNEYETDSFGAEVVPAANGNEWPYQAERVTIDITVTSITDVVMLGRKQQVTDYPTVSLAYSLDINPDTGEARMEMALGRLEPFVFDGFQIEAGEYGLMPRVTPTPTPGKE